MKGVLRGFKELPPGFDVGVTNLIATTKKELQLKFGSRPYHNIDHADRVDIRSKTILRIISPFLKQPITQREYALARISAKAHDVIQPDETEQRRGQSPEEASANWILARMKESDPNAEFFGETDRAIVKEAIIATTPLIFSNGKIRQPNLQNATSPVTIAVALADLNGSGIDGPFANLKDAQNLFLEINRANLPTTAEGRKAKLIEWLERQVQFIADRQLQIPLDIASVRDVVLPPEAKTALIEHCTKNIGDSLEATTSVLNESRGLEYEKILELLEVRANEYEQSA